MNEQTTRKVEFSLPCRFEIVVSEICGRKPSGELDEDGFDVLITDMDTRHFRAQIIRFEGDEKDISNARYKVIESPSFPVGPDEKRKYAVWEAMYDMIAYVLASSVIPPRQRPQYQLEETEDGPKLTYKP